MYFCLCILVLMVCGVSLSRGNSAAVKCRTGFDFDGTECIRITTALVDCPEGMSCGNESVIIPRTPQCPPRTTQVTTKNGKLACKISVKDRSIVVCNHGFVLDQHEDKCIASHGFEATCTCPPNTRPHLNRAMCTYDDLSASTPAAPAGSVARLLLRVSGRWLQNTSLDNLVKTRPVAMTCRCPEGTLTAKQFHQKTADSTFGMTFENEQLTDVGTTHPGHNGCFSVEYHDRLHKCTDGGVGETIDSDFNKTQQNACENILLIDPTFSCREGTVEKCEFSDKDGIGRVKNEKNCVCETRQRVKESLYCKHAKARLVGNTCIQKEAATLY